MLVAFSIHTIPAYSQLERRAFRPCPFLHLDLDAEKTTLCSNMFFKTDAELDDHLQNAHDMAIKPSDQSKLERVVPYREMISFWNKHTIEHHNNLMWCGLCLDMVELTPNTSQNWVSYFEHFTVHLHEATIIELGNESKADERDSITITFRPAVISTPARPRLQIHPAKLLLANTSVNAKLSGECMLCPGYRFHPRSQEDWWLARASHLKWIHGVQLCVRPDYVCRHCGSRNDGRTVSFPNRVLLRMHYHIVHPELSESWQKDAGQPARTYYTLRYYAWPCYLPPYRGLNMGDLLENFATVLLHQSFNLTLETLRAYLVPGRSSLSLYQIIKDGYADLLLRQAYRMGGLVIEGNGKGDVRSRAPFERQMAKRKRRQQCDLGRLTSSPQHIRAAPGSLRSPGNMGPPNSISPWGLPLPLEGFYNSSYSQRSASADSRGSFGSSAGSAQSANSKNSFRSDLSVESAFSGLSFKSAAALSDDDQSDVSRVLNELRTSLKKAVDTLKSIPFSKFSLNRRAWKSLKGSWKGWIVKLDGLQPLAAHIHHGEFSTIAATSGLI